MRILICDDNKDGADTLCALLKAFLPEAELRICYSGLDCVDVAPKWPPDVLLLDIGMPGLNGYEVAKRLRALKECCETFIIAISGWAAKWDREKSSAAGMDLHFAKPVDGQKIVELIRAGRPKPE